MKQSSLSRVFIIRVLLVLFLGQTVILCWSYYNNRHLLSADLTKKIQVVSRLLVSTSSRSLTDYDFTYLGLLMDETLKDGDVKELELLDKSGISVLKKAEKSDGGLKKLEIPVLAGGDKVGTLKVLFSQKKIEDELLHQILIGFAIQGVVFVALIFLIYRFYYANIGNRIALISRFIRNATEGDLTQRMKPTKMDEIGVIATGFDFLVERLSVSINRIKNISDDVSNATMRLNDILQNLVESVSRQQLSTEQTSRAVKEASESQNQIIDNSNKLLSLANDNTVSLTEVGAASEEIAGKVETLNTNINSSYSTVAELGQSAKNVAALAAKASMTVGGVSGSVALIKESVKKIEDSVKESVELSNNTTKVISDKGIVSVYETKASMEKIDLIVGTLSKSIGNLGSRSKDITKILAVIKEVTDETKLLSLNASIIAAQAGEHGKSFAVVAHEIKLLSDKTVGSTIEIEAIVRAIQQDIDVAVRGTGETSKIVHEGGKVVSKAGDALREILGSARKSTEMIKSIEDSAVEQSDGIEHIIGAVNELQTLNYEVNRATEEEEKSISHLVRGISSIKDAMEMTGRAANEQASTLQSIQLNLQAANDRTAEIVAASTQQQHVNGGIIVSMDQIMDIGASTISGFQGVSASIAAISIEIESLRREMLIFRTESKSADECTVGGAV